MLVARVLFAAGLLILFGIAISEYRGESYVYLIFSITANGLLYIGFRKNAIFFDTFIGIFFWLGFWLKLSVRVAFMNSQFHESTGNFDGSGAAFDTALLVASCAFTGLIAASYLREKFLFVYPAQVNKATQEGLGKFYRENRKFILPGFVAIIIVVAVTNVYFGFYQRGSVTRTVLPFGINGVYKWLLLFGLASASALLLKFEYFDNRREGYTVALIALLETFASNVSLLSRGMILNSGALVFGFYKNWSLHRVKFMLRFPILCIVMLVVLFASSVVAVNYFRSIIYPSQVVAKNDESLVLKRTAIHTKLLFLDRWVGIEGVFAVSSYPDKGWEFWWAALQEKYSEDTASFYDSKLIDSPYNYVDTSKHHFVSLPGIVAFCFYPGSYAFLFLCMVLAGFFAFMVELFAYKLGGGNVILCALIGQVIAFRYASFGYVPAQSYLLFGSIFLNVILIYIADKILAAWYRPTSLPTP